jgi:predicted nucleotidyltransferase
MRALGFREDTSEDAPICRWRWKDGIKLDLMPTDPTILGFANRWFADAFVHASPCSLPSGKQIRVVTAPYFIATKLEAFRSRGAGDYMGSKDIEDLAAVLHGREEVVTDVLAASAELRAYLSEHAAKLLGSRAFRQSLEGHLPGEDRTLVTQRLEQIVALRDAVR